MITGRVKKILPWLIAIAFFMEALDTTILNTAIPVVAAALKVAPLSMKLALSSYTLSLAVFIPISSWIADRFGTRLVFTSAIGIFTLGSFLCAISTSIHFLVFCRVLQGCGGAMMIPVGRLTLVRSFEKSELVRALSFLSIPSLIGPMLGPIAGGVIVGFFHWRMIFFLNIPIGILGLYLVWCHLPDYRSEKREPLDLIGLILFSSGIALLSYVLEVFSEHTLKPGEIIGLVIIAGVLLGGYGYHSTTLTYPLLRMSLFRIRTLWIGVSGNFITRLGAAGMPFLLPLFYQIGMGYSPIQSGLLIIPQSIASLVLKVVVPKILTQFGYRPVLLWNTIFTGFFLGLFATIGPHTSGWVIILQACCFGFFSSLQYTSLNTIVFSDILEKDMSMVNTIVSTFQQMSMSFSVGIASLLVAFIIPNHSHATPQELFQALQKTFLFLAGLTTFSAIGFQMLQPTDGDNMRQKNKGH